jgi:hypothetical protein
LVLEVVKSSRSSFVSNGGQERPLRRRTAIR